MAKFSSLAIVLVIAALGFLSVAHCDDFHVEGNIYCDTCRCGFETILSKPIKGAKVGLECKNREGGHVTFTGDGETDKNGKYSIAVNGDHEDDVCEVITKESPVEDCNEPVKGRSSGRVAITGNNGILSPVRHVNALGFLKKEPLSSCAKVIAELGLEPKDFKIDQM